MKDKDKIIDIVLGYLLANPNAADVEHFFLSGNTLYVYRFHA